MAEILSTAFVFDEGLTCELEIEDFSDTEGAIGGIHWAFVKSGKCLSCIQRWSESGPLSQLMSYPGWKRRSFSAWMALPKYYQYYCLAVGKLSVELQ